MTKNRSLYYKIESRYIINTNIEEKDKLKYVFEDELSGYRYVKENFNDNLKRKIKKCLILYAMDRMDEEEAIQLRLDYVHDEMKIEDIFEKITFWDGLNIVKGRDLYFYARIE